MNGHDPPHWTINSCFGASHSIWVHLAMFRYYMKLGAKRVELVQLMQKIVPWSRIRIFRNEWTQSTPLDLKLMFGAPRSVWVHLAMFHYYRKLVAKRVELVQLMHKFVPWSRFGIYRKECTRPTPLDSKLMFWCVSLYLGAFGNVSLLHETQCKTGWTGAINAQVCAIKSHQNFSQRMHSILPIGTKPMFWSVS